MLMKTFLNHVTCILYFLYVFCFLNDVFENIFLYKKKFLNISDIYVVIKQINMEC